MSKETDELDLAWGAKAIATVLGRTVRQTFHLLESGVLDEVAQKKGGLWVADRRRLRDHFLNPRANASEAA